MLKKLKIGQQLAIGFGLIIILLLVMAGTSLVSFYKSSDNFLHYQEYAIDGLISGQVEANILIANDAGNKFVQTREPKYYEEFQRRYALTLDITQKQNAHLQDSERKAASDETLTLLANYKTLAETTFEKMAIRDKLLQETMSPSGKQMRRDLSDLMKLANEKYSLALTSLAGQAQEHLLLGRLYALKFLETNNLETETFI